MTCGASGSARRRGRRCRRGPPYVLISLAAVFSPTPARPGGCRSGRRGGWRTPGTCAGVTPRALGDAGLVVERVVADAAPVVEHLDAGVRHQLVRVAVAGDDDDLVADRRDPWSVSRGHDVVGLGSPRGRIAVMPSACSTSRTSPICCRKMSGAASVVALYLGVGLVAEGRLRPVERHQNTIPAGAP